MAYAVACVVVCLDQLTKHWVSENFVPGCIRPVIGGLFNLTFVRNDGAAFGVFRGNNIFFIALSLIAVVVILVLRGRYKMSPPVVKLGVGLILGGAVGNLIDRLLRGSVIDFLDFHAGPYHWPAFNLADSSICIGVALIIMFSMRKKTK